MQRVANPLRATFSSFCAPRKAPMMNSVPSYSYQTGVTWGRPSGRTVASAATLGSRRKAATSGDRTVIGLRPHQLAAGEAGERLAVLLAGPLDDLRRQLGRRRLPDPTALGPGDAHQLLVEAGLRAATLVFVCRPESAGVGRQALVDEDNLVV